MDNTGTGLIISTLLILGAIYGFEWYHILIIVLASMTWLITVDTNLTKKYRKLLNEKLELEVELLKKKVQKTK